MVPLNIIGLLFHWHISNKCIKMTNFVKWFRWIRPNNNFNDFIWLNVLVILRYVHLLLGYYLIPKTGFFMTTQRHRVIVESAELVCGRCLDSSPLRNDIAEHSIDPCSSTSAFLLKSIQHDRRRWKVTTEWFLFPFSLAHTHLKSNAYDNYGWRMASISLTMDDR